jgi:hypothetical protein
MEREYLIFLRENQMLSNTKLIQKLNKINNIALWQIQALI